MIRHARSLLVRFPCETLLGGIEKEIERKTLCGGILGRRRPVLERESFSAVRKRCSIVDSPAVPGLTLAGNRQEVTTRRCMDGVMCDGVTEGCTAGCRTGEGIGEA